MFTLSRLIGAATLAVLTFTTVSAADKPDLNVVMAGSASGTFNSFNKVLVSDLEKFYNITKVPGGSEIKGNKIFQQTDSNPVYVMTKTGYQNARSAVEGNGDFHPGVSAGNMVLAISYYKTICMAAGKDIESIFTKGSSLKIGLTEGITPSNKYVANLNRIVGSNHIMVPYKSSGKSATGVITGDIDAVLLNEAKALKILKGGQLTCKYTQNPAGGNGFKPLTTRINDDWFGWTYRHLLLGHVKHVSNAFAKTLYTRIQAIMSDPKSNTSMKLKKNGWYGEVMSQEDMFKTYEQAYDNTTNLLK
jgi:tripartite-type tricarboxylate transporter receptor subunit TctC